MPKTPATNKVANHHWSMKEKARKPKIAPMAAASNAIGCGKPSARAPTKNKAASKTVETMGKSDAQAPDAMPEPQISEESFNLSKRNCGVFVTWHDWMPKTGFETWQVVPDSHGWSKTPPQTAPAGTCPNQPIFWATTNPPPSNNATRMIGIQTIPFPFMAGKPPTK